MIQTSFFPQPEKDEPNCQRIKDRIRPGFDKWSITVMEDIEEGEELTLKYKLYVPK